MWLGMTNLQVKLVMLKTEKLLFGTLKCTTSVDSGSDT